MDRQVPTRPPLDFSVSIPTCRAGLVTVWLRYRSDLCGTMEPTNARRSAGLDSASATMRSRRRNTPPMRTPRRSSSFPPDSHGRHERHLAIWTHAMIMAKRIAAMFTDTAAPTDGGQMPTLCKRTR